MENLIQENERTVVDISGNRYKSKTNVQLLKMSKDLQDRHEKIKELLIKKVDEMEEIETEYKLIMEIFLWRKS
jgi:hypothetical protein